MTDELRERLWIIQGFVDMDPVDSDELYIVWMRKAECFTDLVSEVERLEAENERLRKRLAQADLDLNPAVSRTFLTPKEG